MKSIYKYITIILIIIFFLYLSNFKEDLGVFYKIDSGHVYGRTCLDCWTDSYEIMPSVDLESFRILGNSYAVDKNRVYFWGKEFVGADPSTFEIINATTHQYSKDKNHVYMSDHIISNNPKLFHIILETDFDSYSTDNELVYYNGNSITGADAKSFRVMKGFFSKDANAVYCNKNKIPNADPNSFTVLDKQYGKDSVNVFFCSQYSVLGGDGYAKPFIVNGAESNSFVIPINGWDIKRKADAYDKYHGYIDGQLIR